MDDKQIKTNEDAINLKPLEYKGLTLPMDFIDIDSYNKVKEELEFAKQVIKNVCNDIVDTDLTLYYDRLIEDAHKLGIRLGEDDGSW